MTCKFCRKRRAVPSLKSGWCGECLVEAVDENAVGAICAATSLWPNTAKAMVQRMGWRRAIAAAEAMPRNSRRGQVA